LLCLAMAFQLGNITGFTSKLLPGGAANLMPVLTAFAGAASSLGAFFGGLSVARHPFRAGALVFWALLAANFFLTISGLLLYGACGIVFACAMGLGFGARRVPWVFLLVSILLVGFLNEGKSVMRGIYWDPESGVSRASLSQLPEFYYEWSQASLYLYQLSASGNTQSSALASDVAGQSLVDRLDNFQNLTFIVDTFESGSSRPLYGKTYTLIPALLIPRFFWPDKPRTHEGQVMLNLNFGRQSSEEETFNTYIAWGLLPEAVGNFGCVGGACFLGLLAGFGCGLLETWSARKRVLSVEGLVAIALLLALAVSYEMVASVFVTATFQLLVAVIILGLLLRHWFLNSQPPGQGRSSARRRNSQMGEPKVETEQPPADLSAGKTEG